MEQKILFTPVYRLSSAWLVLALLLLASCGGGSNKKGRTRSAAVVELDSDKVYLWVTEDTYSGDLLGVTGADQLCADSAPPSAVFPDDFTHQAVLADEAASVNPEDIISPGDDSRGIYRLDGNTKIGDSWQDFFDAGIDASNAITETAEEYWTGLSAAGTPRRVCIATVGRTTLPPTAAASEMAEPRPRRIYSPRPMMVAIRSITYSA